METEDLLDELERQGAVLVRTAKIADLSTVVPSCPEWTVEQLLRHCAKVERWAVTVLRGADPNAFRYQPVPADDVEAELAAAVADVLLTLRKARDSLAVWTLRPTDNARRFWIRRQAHELAMHRVDLQLAVGYGVDEFEPEFAADGVDELLVGLWGPGAARGPGSPRLRTVSLTPLDANASWLVGFGESTVHCRRGASDRADLSVFAMASELYRWVWNRARDDEVSLNGDVTLADRWRQELTVTDGFP